ncbi:hypothetical protein D9M70_589190 [compost metagenome]
MPALAAWPAWYSRAQLVSAAMAMPLAEVAESAMAWARRGASRRKSRPAATQAPNTVDHDP